MRETTLSTFENVKAYPHLLFGYATEHNDDIEITTYLEKKLCHPLSELEACFFPVIADIVGLSLKEAVYLPTLNELLYKIKWIDLSVLIYVGFATQYGIKHGMAEYTKLAKDLFPLLIADIPILPEGVQRETNYRELRKQFLDALQDEVELTPLEDLRRFGLFFAQNSKLSLHLAFSGKGGGMGSLLGHQGGIRCFGPSYFPLGQMDLFGIQRSIHDSDLFDDVEVTQDKIHGFTKVIGNEEAIWLGMKARLLQNKCYLSLQVENCEEGEKPMAFVFFVEADRIIIRDEVLEKGLKQYRGKSQDITFEKGNVKYFLTLEESVPMQIIPLAGDNHFWGGDFLVAYEISTKNSIYNWLCKT